MARSSPSRVQRIPDSFRKGLPSQEAKDERNCSVLSRNCKEPQRIPVQRGKGPGNVVNPSEEVLGLQGSLVSCPLRKVVTIIPCLRPNNA